MLHQNAADRSANSLNEASGFDIGQGYTDNDVAAEMIETRVFNPAVIALRCDVEGNEDGLRKGESCAACATIPKLRHATDVSHRIPELSPQVREAEITCYHVSVCDSPALGQPNFLPTTQRRMN